MPGWLRRVGVRLVDAERVALGVEVVALPSHPGERHLRQSDLPSGVQDAAFGLVVVADTHRAHETVRALTYGRRGGGPPQQASVDAGLILWTGHGSPVGGAGVLAVVLEGPVEHGGIERLRSLHVVSLDLEVHQAGHADLPGSGSAWMHRATFDLVWLGVL